MIFVNGADGRAARMKDFRRIQRQIQDFVAAYRRRVITPRNMSEEKGVREGIAFQF
jgi:hypothetical protein